MLTWLHSLNYAAVLLHGEAAVQVLEDGAHCQLRTCHVLQQVLQVETLDKNWKMFITLCSVPAFFSLKLFVFLLTLCVTVLSVGS